MGNNPRIKGRIDDFATIASVSVGNLRFRKCCPTLGTTPLVHIEALLLQCLPRAASQVWLCVQILFLLKNAIGCPPLNALHMKNTEAFLTRPHWILPFQVRYANKTWSGWSYGLDQSFFGPNIDASGLTVLTDIIRTKYFLNKLIRVSEDNFITRALARIKLFVVTLDIF